MPSYRRRSYGTRRYRGRRGYSGRPARRTIWVRRDAPGLTTANGGATVDLLPESSIDAGRKHSSTVVRTHVDWSVTFTNAFSALANHAIFLGLARMDPLDAGNSMPEGHWNDVDWMYWRRIPLALCTSQVLGEPSTAVQFTQPIAEPFDVKSQRVMLEHADSLIFFWQTVGFTVPAPDAASLSVTSSTLLKI